VTRLVGAVVIGVTATTTVSVVAQVPVPSNVVWVQAVVRDAQGKLVQSLNAADFRVLATGELRPVTIVSKNELPMALSLMLDVSVSMAFQNAKVRRSAELLTKEFGRGDRVNIGAFQGPVLVTPRFTANPTRILGSLEQPATGADERCEPPGPTVSSLVLPAKPTGGTALWDAVWCGVNVLLRDREAIRRVLLVMSDGFENGSVTPEQTAIRFAQLNGVMVYTVGFRAVDATARGSRSDRRLRDLAAATGGRYFPVEEKNPLEPVFREIGDELRAHYVIGFEPRSPNSRGALQVSATTPGLSVRTRAQYSANGR
jgi:VWFA-related protein